LEEAERQEFFSVTLPAIRTGVMAGVVEKTVGEALQAMADGIADFVASGPQHVGKITIVVFRDPDSVGELREKIPASIES
jgi:hypothetical protein